MMIDDFKEEINKSLREIQKITIKHVKEMKKNCSRYKNKNRSNKEKTTCGNLGDG